MPDRPVVMPDNRGPRKLQVFGVVLIGHLHKPAEPHAHPPAGWRVKALELEL